MADLMTCPTNDFFLGQAKQAEHGLIGIENADISLQKD
jgi:hypothetical protein